MADHDDTISGNLLLGDIVGQGLVPAFEDVFRSTEDESAHLVEFDGRILSCAGEGNRIDDFVIFS